MELIATAQNMRNVALVRALSKTADQVNMAASRAVRCAGYNLKASTIKQALKVHHASQA